MSAIFYSNEFRTGMRSPDIFFDLSQRRCSKSNANIFTLRTTKNRYSIFQKIWVFT